MFEYKYSQRELEIEQLRRNGMPYSKIAEKYGITYQRVQGIHERTLEKLRTTRDVRRNWASLAKVCEERRIDNIRFMAIVKALKRAGVLTIRSRLLNTYEDCLKINGIGKTYAELIMAARKKEGLWS